MKRHGLSWDRVVNIDETAVRLLPTVVLGSSGDLEGSVTTVTVAWSPLVGPIPHQLIFEGKTAAIPPTGPLPEHQCRAFNASTRSNSIGPRFLAAVAGIRLGRRALGGRPRLYPATRCRFRCCRDQPPCCLMYVQRNTTPFKQPLDIRYMRSIKNTFKHISAQNFARDVVSKIDEVGFFHTHLLGGCLRCSCTSLWRVRHGKLEASGE